MYNTITGLQPSLGHAAPRALDVRNSHAASLPTPHIHGERGHLSPPALVQSSVLAALSEQLGLSAPRPNPPAGQDFSPAAVAERILGFVDAHIAKAQADGADPEAALDLLTQARAGIEQGFAEARDILDQLGVLQGQVAADVDDTYARLQQGLDERVQVLTGAPAPGEDDSIGAPGAGTAAVSQSAQVTVAASSAEAFSLKLATQDGDEIDISFSRASAYASSAQFSRDGSGSHYALSESFSQSSSWQYSLSGELDDGERAALDDLLRDVDKLSEHFFAGRTQAAFEQALHLDFDASEFASLQLDASRSRSVSASLAYQEVAELSGPAPATPAVADAAGSVEPPAADALSALPAFLRELSQSLHAFGEHSRLQQPEQFFAGVFEQLLSHDPRSEPKHQAFIDWLGDFMAAQSAQPQTNEPVAAPVAESAANAAE